MKKILRLSNTLQSVARWSCTTLPPEMHQERCSNLVFLRDDDLPVLELLSCRNELCTSHHLVSIPPSPSLHLQQELTFTRLANLTEASQIIDYICMCWIYLYFYRALKKQGWDRKDLPYVGWAQPYCAWFGLGTMIFTVSCYGYTTFLPGCEYLSSPLILIYRKAIANCGTGWDVGTFFSYYTMVFVCPILYVGWKVWWKTKVIKPEEADLVRPPISSLTENEKLTQKQVWERPVIDAYEANVLEPHMTFWEEIKMMGGWKKKEEHIHAA